MPRVAWAEELNLYSKSYDDVSISNWRAIKLYTGIIVVWTLFEKLFWKETNMTHTKTVLTDLDSPRRDLALLVFSEIIFCVCLLGE